ncbi:DUF1207 domain-containing protein [Spirosoma montaniterrae]|uniref:DUF1207 domain-containing protein n=1 Tax=Spirosoma montaniterrae TaxID=1178516 RepID=A0A1P9X4L6_9BACT|nr:DUF1207 domain-containing protein [Spirosoma montaniterrae]AQG82596.1 hypothetical protein AWR27_19715 [Spirosoma montaniterrae]
MKHPLLTLLLLGITGTTALAQQPKTTAPAARTLTPAEQRQKEKVEREVQRERQIRAEWAQKQREYEARQAEKERQRQAKRAGKEPEPPKQTTSAPQPTVTPAPTAVEAPTTAKSAPAEPSRKEKREKRRKETPAEPAPPAPATLPVVTEPVKTAPTPVEAAPPAVKAERPKREKKQRPAKTVDSVSVAPATVASEPAVVTRPKHEFLPKGHLFDPILLDPLEAQTYGSVLPVYYTEGQKYKGSIVPFAFGFAKPFYRRTTAPGRSEELVLDLASFTQFEVYWDADKGRQRRQIMNNDYKVSIIYNVRRGMHNWRFRVYHLSAHLGDDFIYRNRITAPSPNPVNYEVLDATYSRMVGDWRVYGGLGIGLRKREERERLSAQIGTFYRKTSERAARLVGGVDVKFWQQTDFRPGIHGGIGVEVGRTQNNITFLLEGYSGFRPYSQFEQQQTSWIGVGVYLNPF